MIDGKEENVKPEIMQIGSSLSIYEAGNLRNEFAGHLNGHDSLFIALDSVETCDTAGIQLLLSAQKTAKKAGKDFGVVRPSEVFLSVLKDMGLKPEKLNINP